MFTMRMQRKKDQKQITAKDAKGGKVFDSSRFKVETTAFRRSDLSAMFVAWFAAWFVAWFVESNGNFFR